MTRKVLNVLLLFICSECMAQRYLVEYDVEFFLNRNGLRYYNTLYYTTSNNVTRTMPQFEFHQLRDSYLRVQGHIEIPASDGPINHLWIWNFYQKRTFGWNSNDDYHKPIDFFKSSSNQTEFSLSNLYWGALTYKGSHVTTHKFIAYPELLFIGAQPTLLPSKEKVLITNTAGFPHSAYKWQYSTDGAQTWINVPSSVINSSPNGSLKISGTDLMSESAFQQLAAQGRPVLFRIFNPVKSSEVISLQAALSSPIILSHEVVLERCHQSGDAIIKMTLDRPLLSGEVLSCFINGQSIGNAGNITLDSNNSFYLGGYNSGTYAISFKGSYNGNNTYTGDPRHKFTAIIAERPAITHSFTQKNISCFSGHDGEITLAASGGTGNFTATLTDAGGSIVQTQTFNTGNVSFKRLSAGNYTLRVQDSNGCVAKTSSGEELIHQVVLTEPNEAVRITEKSKTSPLAYQSSDGAIQIAVSGGTPSTSGYTVRFVRKSDGQVFTPTDSHSDGSQYIYTLRNIPRGEYTAIAEDMRFALLGNEDKQDPCGCHAQLAITLSAPPLLTVDVEETHFISCHGDSDGELTAHGKGGKPIISAHLPYTYTWYKISGSTKEQLPLQIDSVAHNLSTGQYQVKITDSNGISVESAVFELKQPDLLSLSFTTRPPSCSGGAGLISTTVTGGTAPYTYEWNKEGATEANLTINEAGSFFVRVVDSRGCSITGNVEVTTPEAISIKPTITNPTCYGADNGAISLELSGGTAPYTIHWEDDNTLSTSNREHLKAGEYVAVISDQAGCSLHYRVVLEQPEKMTVKLSSGFTLCHEQSRKITAIPSEENVTYQWLHDGQALTETSKELTVSKAGHYRVVVTNEKGCTATAEVEIKASNTELPLDITIPSSVTAGSPIHAVNISRIRADKLEWSLPDNAVITSKSNESVVFTIPTPGIYEVILTGYLGDCSTVVSQRLEVLGEGGVVLPDGKGDAIKQFLVSPNPTTGDFKVYVELKEPRDFTLRLLSPTSVEMDKKEIKNIQKHTFEYELRGDTEGVFKVELSVGNEKSTLRITKKRK